MEEVVECTIYKNGIEQNKRWPLLSNYTVLVYLHLWYIKEECQF